MIARILVPNRGEIAVRIARACREMGIASVLAYSESDDVRHVRRFFDETVSLGAGDARETYLDILKIIEAARSTRADAIHPGYGFLSERAALAIACEESGLTFIGPKAKSIAAMGSKADSRRLMQSFGVPVVPGYDDEDQSIERLEREAETIGFPLLVKASAGGGGKGMKIVRSRDDIRPAIESAQREAVKAFGDGRLLLEKFIEQPRHVEFQILGDGHGNIIHLFERDCSIQRRHQKIVEESPAPRYSDDLRARMGEAAIAAARAVDYQNAGTVEFIVTPAGDFFFLEMNTRLQVEHPVTELVTGIDLVRAQIEVASGRPLPWKQKELAQRGHAIEARIYAEDPDDRFLPQSGTIARYLEPSGPGVRVDAGVGEGSHVGVQFDPMMAKLICYAEDRAACIDRLSRALRDYVILGMKANISYLRRVVDHPAFREGVVSTHFIDDHATVLQSTVSDVIPLIAAALAGAHVVNKAVAAPGQLPSVWEEIGPWGRN